MMRRRLRLKLAAPLALGVALACGASPALAAAPLGVQGPPEGSTLFLDRSTEFAMDRCTVPPNPPFGWGYGVWWSDSPTVDAGGVLTPQPDEVESFNRTTASTVYVDFDPTATPYEDLPQDGTTIYWQAVCGYIDGSGTAHVDGASVPRAMPVSLGDRPPGPARKEVGVSIDQAETYTREPQVKISVVLPEFSDYEIEISNDGGFGDSKTFQVKRDWRDTINWKLRSSGPERLPKTVYVRFTQGVTDVMTDDIILDETPPELRSVSFASRGGSKVAKLRIKARDEVSGVAEMQVTSRKPQPGKWKRFKKRVTVQQAGPKVFVRVRDDAGNKSKWKRAK